MNIQIIHNGSRSNVTSLNTQTHDGITVNYL